jgi:GT2 family glycosyltransferase
MRISIIIAVKDNNEFLKECIEKCRRLTYRDYEIIVLPDKEFFLSDTRIKVIPTGPILPAKKRDIGSAHATGEILAFLDDDAYPCESWLTSAVRHFDDKDVAGVAGPAVTPPTEGFLSEASGLVYSSLVVSGSVRYRYRKDRQRYIDDYPSCNLLVRKDIFESIGGFKTNFWPGEDTILCLEIVKRLKKKIIYDPEVLVFHHRRPLYGAHLKQIRNYALHRGYFVKRFPETSLKWQYFIPTLLWFLLLGGAMAVFVNPSYSRIYLILLVGYVCAVAAGAWQRRDLKLTSAVAAGILLTHFFYGLYFLVGLLRRKLKEEEGAET